MALTEQQQNYIYREHCNMSIDELSAAYNKKVSAVLSSTNAFEAQVLSDEMNYIMSILNTRKDAENKYKEYREHTLPDRKKEAVLNLETAVSPNGQLVAAILEEEKDGKTFDEIHKWCDEMRAFSDEELQELLDNLEEEGIISLENNIYHLENICTEDLFKRSFKKGKGIPVRTSSYLEVIKMNGFLIHRQDLQRKGVEYKLLPSDKRQFQWDKESELIEMYKAGLLTKEGEYYYLPLLGEK